MVISSVLLIIISIFLLGIASAAGATILRWFRFSFSSNLETAVFAFGVGVPLASYMVFGAGTMGWINKIMVLAVFACLLMLSLPTLIRIFQILRSYGYTFNKSSYSWNKLTIILLCILIIHTLFNLVGSLSPPTQPDGLNYHLGAVKYYITQGYIGFVPYRAWNAPFTSEMWNLIGLLLGDIKLPNLFVYSFGLISMLAVYKLGERLGGYEVGLLTATLYYTSTFVTTITNSAKSDLLMMLFIFLSFSSLLQWQVNRETRWLVLSGIFTGLVCATKIQGLYWLVAFSIGVIWMMCMDKDQSMSLRLRNIVLWGIFALLVVSPWWLRNWIQAGDPVWPYGYGLFSSKYWTHELAAKYAHWTRGPGDGIWYYLTGLWNLTTRAAIFHPSSTVGIMFTISPALLAFIPGVIVCWRRFCLSKRDNLITICVVVIVYYTVWFVNYQHPRYLLPMLALLGIPAAMAYQSFHEYRKVYFVATVLLFASFTLTMAMNVFFNLQYLPVVIGRESQDEFLKKKVSFYEDIQWVNTNLETNSKLMVFPLKTFYFDVPVVRADRNVWDYNVSASEFIVQLQSKGVTHIFLPHDVENYYLEYGFDYILKQLEHDGILRVIYNNPEAIQINSRTLSRYSYISLDIYKVVYPKLYD